MIRPRQSPLWLAAKLALVLIYAFLAYYGYGFQRTRSGPLARTVDEKIGYALRMAGWMAAPVALIGLPALSVCLYRRFDIPRERLVAGLCPACKYPLVERGAVCPECGVATVAPDRTTLQTSVRFIAATLMILLLGTALGSCFAEIRIAPDERAFIAEVKALGPSHWRLRRGPFYGELYFFPTHGFWVVDD